MHPETTVASVLKLHRDGLNNCEISRRTGVSRPTVREWTNGRLPRSYKADVARLDEFVGPKR
jgi:transposase